MFGWQEILLDSPLSNLKILGMPKTQLEVLMAPEFVGNVWELKCRVDNPGLVEDAVVVAETAGLKEAHDEGAVAVQEVAKGDQGQEDLPVTEACQGVEVDQWHHQDDEGQDLVQDLTKCVLRHKNQFPRIGLIFHFS